MVLASLSQLALSSGVVAAIWPRICRPTRKSERLKAASASLRSVAEDLATGPASLLIWASSFTAESARSSRLKALSAAQAAVRPSASVAQITVARTTPIMMDLPADQRRVTSKNARKGDGLMALDWACEKVACMALAVQTVPAAPLGGVPAAGFMSGKPQSMAHRLPWSRHQRSRFDLLGGKADFS